MAKQGLLVTLRERYRRSSKNDKGRMIHPQLGRHRRLHRLDRSGSAVGHGAIVDCGGAGAIGQRLPFCTHGIDSDSDGAFINETLIGYCAERRIEFTLSRAYRSNGQAWIEQTDGNVMRRFVGHDRYSGQVAGKTMAYRYGASRLYVNFFQPSFKLIDKIRYGGTTVKRYSPPTTPCDRVI